MGNRVSVRRPTADPPRPYIMDLPEDVLEKFYKKLPLKDILALRKTCKHFRDQSGNYHDFEITVEDRPPKKCTFPITLPAKSMHLISQQHHLHKVHFMSKLPRMFMDPTILQKLSVKIGRDENIPLMFNAILKECGPTLRDIEAEIESTRTTLLIVPCCSTSFLSLQRLCLIDQRKVTPKQRKNFVGEDMFLQLMENASKSSNLKTIIVKGHLWDRADLVATNSTLITHEAIFALINTYKALDEIEIFDDVFSPDMNGDDYHDIRFVDISFENLDAFLDHDMVNVSKITLNMDVNKIPTMEVWEMFLRAQENLQEFNVSTRYVRFEQLEPFLRNVITSNESTLMRIKMRFWFQAQEWDSCAQEPLDMSMFKNCPGLKSLQVEQKIDGEAKTTGCRQISNIECLPTTIKHLSVKDFWIPSQALDSWLNRSENLSTVEFLNCSRVIKTDEFGVNDSVLQTILHLPGLIHFNV